MPFVATCPNCGLNMNAPDSAAGKRIRCKKCQKPVLLTPPSRKQNEFSFTASAPAARYGRRQKEGSNWGLWLFLFVLIAGGGAGVGYVIWQDREEARRAESTLSDPKQLADALKGKISSEFPEIKVPSSNTPKTDPPKVDPPKSDPPKVDPPKVDPPKVDPPKIDPPKSDPPKVDPPKVDPPTMPEMAAKPPTDHEMTDGIRAFAFLPDNKHGVAWLGQDNKHELLLLESATGKEIKRLPLPNVDATAFTLSDKPNEVLLGVRSKGVHVVDLENGMVKREIQGIKLPIRSLVLSRDHSLLAVGQTGGFAGSVVQVFEFTTGKVRFEKTLQGGLHGLALSPNNKILMAADPNRVVLWDLDTGAELRSIPGTAGQWTSAALSRDGKLLAAGIVANLTGGALHVWNVDTGLEALAIKNDRRGCIEALFGPDDRTVLGTFDDWSTRVFDLKTGDEYGGFRRYSLVPGFTVLAHDGRNLMTSHQTKLRYWDLPAGLEKLTKPGEWFGQAVVEGKVIERAKIEQPFQFVEGIHQAIRGATFVKAVNGSVIEVNNSGKAVQLYVKAKSKVLGLDGKPVAPEQRSGLYRFGNVFDAIALLNNPAEVIELRLVREQSGEPVLSQVRASQWSDTEITFVDANKKSTTCRYGGSARFVKVGGEAVENIPLNRCILSVAYDVTLRADAGGKAPEIVEMREVTSLAQLWEVPHYLKMKEVSFVMTVNKPGAKPLPGLPPSNPAFGKKPWVVTPHPAAKFRDAKDMPIPFDELLKPDVKMDVLLQQQGNAWRLISAKLLPAP